MARSVPEWVGPTPDTRPPPRVRLRVFESHGGTCHLTGRKIRPGDAWELEHVVAIINGGENREGNMAPALRDAHRKKTAQDVAEKSKVNRIKAKHLGIRKVSSLTHPTLKRRVDGSVVRR